MFTLETMNAVLIAPVFYFLGIVLFLFTILCLLTAMAANTKFLLIACITFVLGYNAVRFASMMRQS